MGRFFRASHSPSYRIDKHHPRATLSAVGAFANCLLVTSNSLFGLGDRRVLFLRSIS